MIQHALPFNILDFCSYDDLASMFYDARNQDRSEKEMLTNVEQNGDRHEVREGEFAESSDEGAIDSGYVQGGEREGGEKYEEQCILSRGDERTNEVVYGGYAAVTDDNNSGAIANAVASQSIAKQDIKEKEARTYESAPKRCKHDASHSPTRQNENDEAARNGEATSLPVMKLDKETLILRPNATIPPFVRSTFPNDEIPIDVEQFVEWNSETHGSISVNFLHQLVTPPKGQSGIGKQVNGSNADGVGTHAAGNAEALAEVSTCRDTDPTKSKVVEQLVGPSSLMVREWLKGMERSEFGDNDCQLRRHLQHSYKSFDTLRRDNYISSRTKKCVKGNECDNLRPNFRNTEFISSLPFEWVLLSPQAQAQIMPLLIWLMTLFDDREDKGYSKVDRDGTAIEVVCRILQKSLGALRDSKITCNEVIFGKHRKKDKSIELKWGALVEFKLSQNMLTSYKAKVDNRRKLQFSCTYNEVDEVVRRGIVRRGNKTSRILHVLIEHAVRIGTSVISMLEAEGEAYVTRKEYIQSQVYNIVNKQQPEVEKAIIQIGYFSENYQDPLFGKALHKACDKILELLFNTISCIDEGRYFDCK
jgi:hypothetical protein